MAFRQLDHAPVYLDTGEPESVPGHGGRGFWPDQNFFDDLKLKTEGLGGKGGPAGHPGAGTGQLRRLSANWLRMKCGGVDLFTAQPIGFIHSPYLETSAIPKGLGARHDAEGAIELLREYEPGLKDIEGFSHLFVLWEFDRADGFDLIAHPPADAGRPHGVFSTRSPRRPNPIGLTVVELLGREGTSLRVRGVDMLDGTPVLDIKPYLSSVPAEKMRRGWLEEAEKRGSRE